MEICPHGNLKRKCEICERDDIIAELKEELQLNAKMLARQTDMAREAEARVMELDKENQVLQSLYSAERAMHSRDTVDFNERLEKAGASLSKLREAVKVHEKKTMESFGSCSTRFDEDLWATNKNLTK